jgi:hypothetical protein
MLLVSLSALTVPVSLRVIFDVHSADAGIRMHGRLWDDRQSPVILFHGPRSAPVLRTYQSVTSGSGESEHVNNESCSHSELVGGQRHCLNYFKSEGKMSILHSKNHQFTNTDCDVVSGDELGKKFSEIVLNEHQGEEMNWLPLCYYNDSRDQLSIK